MPVSIALVVAVLLCLGPRGQLAFGPSAPPKKKTAFGPGAPSGPSPEESSETSTVRLLGKETWILNDWRAETDDIRGGKSVASFKGVADRAEFSGKVDTAIGDGYAGVSLQVDLLPLDLAETKGLVLHLAKADKKEYAVALRMLGAPAGVQHQFRFIAKTAEPIEIYFRDFEPVLRGKPAPEPKPKLALERVQSIILQASSDYAKQDGSFSIEISKVDAIPGRELPPPPPPARKTKWTCTSCGTMNMDIHRYCVRCGDSRFAEEEKAAIAAKQEERKKQVKWTCDGCGTKNFHGVEECFKCGAPRG